MVDHFYGLKALADSLHDVQLEKRREELVMARPQAMAQMGYANMGMMVLPIPIPALPNAPICDKESYLVNSMCMSKM